MTCCESSKVNLSKQLIFNLRLEHQGPYILFYIFKSLQSSAVCVSGADPKA